MTNYSPMPAYSIKSPALRAMAMKQERDRKIALMYEAKMAAVVEVKPESKPEVITDLSTPKQIDKRTAKATQLVLGDRFIQSDKGSWYCQSQSDETKLYMVSPNHCTCPDHQFRKSICKHIRGYRVLVEKLDQEAQAIKDDLGW